MPTTIRERVHAAMVWARQTVGRRRMESEMAEEMRFHLEARAADLEREGMTSGEALRRARSEFGSRARYRDEARQALGFRWLDDLIRDVRHGLLSFGRYPLYTTVLVLTLALGIGATTTIFSVMNAAMLRPLPYPDAERLVRVTMVDPLSGDWINPSVAALNAWKEGSRLFEGFGSLGDAGDFTLSGQRIFLGWVDTDLLPLLGVQPMLGRLHLPEDSAGRGASSTLVISYGLWQSQLGADESILGKPFPNWNIPWAGTPIGVMPPGFRVVEWRLDGWFAGSSALMPADQRRLVLARVKTGVSLDQAEAELGSIFRGVAESAPDNAEWAPHVEGYRESTARGYAGTLNVLMGAVFFVLLIACVNVANLQLGRAIARDREMATRAALGAGRLRLIRQQLVENITLAAAGGALGILLALVGIRIFFLLAPDFYYQDDIRLDATVLLFTFGVTFLAGVLFGIVPALRTSHRLDDRLREGARKSIGKAGQWLRRSLVVGEVAMAVILLVGAGLMINSYLRLTGVDPGFDADNLQTMQISLLGMDAYRIRYPSAELEIRPQHDTFLTNLIERLAALPQVEEVGMATALPSACCWGKRVRTTGQDDGEMVVYQEVNADYFHAMRIPLVRGRGFTEQDSGTSPPVAIVDEATAEQLFQGQDPLGQTISVTVNPNNPALGDEVREVVGVVGDTLISPREDVYLTVYIPYLQHARHYDGAQSSFVTADKAFVIRTERAGSASLVREVRRVVADLDPVVAAADLRTMRDSMSLALIDEQLVTRTLGVFAGLSIFLAALGIYGVLAHAVALRQHEFGIRMALGAGWSSVLGMVMREGLLLTLIGIALGMAGAIEMTRVLLIQLPLFQITPTDPPTLIAAGLFLVAVAAAACYIPARRASRNDIVNTLRAE